MSLRLAVLALVLVWSVRAEAHNLAISVMSLREVGGGEFIASWERVQGISDPSAAFLLLRPVFPEHCEFRAPRLSCGEKSLSGTLGFAGLGDLSAKVMVQLYWQRAPSQAFTFSAAEPRVRVDLPSKQAPSWLHVAKNLTWIGIEHIALGWDHLLFVLGLLWLVRTLGALIRTLTAFTLAHSLTLAAATLGFTNLPIPAVEAVIALSIAFVAVEVVQQARDGVTGWTGRAPWLVAFGFGLLHGLGFASALSELELARDELPLSLLFFNVGVELGQLGFVLAALALGSLLRRLGPSFTQRAAPLAHYAMGSAAMYWFTERMVAMVAAGR